VNITPVYYLAGWRGWGSINTLFVCFCLRRFHSYLLFSSKLTERLAHQREVSGHGRLDLEGQGHDRKGYCPASFRSSPCHHRPEDHGDGHDVVSGEDSEVVVPESQNPPDGAVE
jgi:hypothetical protein